MSCLIRHKLQQWVTPHGQDFFSPFLPSVPSFFLAALWVLCLNNGDYASHLEETSLIVLIFFFVLFLTRPLARASCSKRNYATSPLSQASLQREAHQGSLMAVQAGSFSTAGTSQRYKLPHLPFVASVTLCLLIDGSSFKSCFRTWKYMPNRDANDQLIH